MTVPDLKQLTVAIRDATRKVAQDLFREHPGDYYYFTLIMSGEAPPPFVSALSGEALDAAVAAGARRDSIEWDYASSPYLDYGSLEFAEVRRLFLDRENTRDVASESEEEALAECDLRMSACEAALAALDSDGLFGSGQDRNRIVVASTIYSSDLGPTPNDRFRIGAGRRGLDAGLAAMGAHLNSRMK